MEGMKSIKGLARRRNLVEIGGIPKPVWWTQGKINILIGLIVLIGILSIPLLAPERW